MEEDGASLQAAQAATKKEMTGFKIEVLAKLGGIAASQAMSDSRWSSNGLSMGGSGGLNVPSFSHAGFLWS